MPDSASLEIHVMNVGQGDSVLVVNRDLVKTKAAITKAKKTPPADPIKYVPFALKNGVPLAGTVKKALLVDGGDDEYGGDVLNYMTDQGVLDTKKTVSRPDLSLVVSHYHDDHMAGLRSVFKERIEPKKKGDKVKLVERLRPGAVYQSWPESKTNPTSERFAAFQDDMVTAAGAATNPTRRFYVYPGGLDGPTAAAKTIKIDLGTGVDGIPITAYILAAGQAVWNKQKKKVVKIASTGSTVDQNDRSVVLMLEYGSFRCLLGGDIAGNGGPDGGNTGANAAAVGTKKFFSQHADVETDLGRALEAYFPKTVSWDVDEPKYPTAGYASVLKANHHGSSSSVDVYLLATLQPMMYVGSSGVKARFHNHPTQAVMNRINYTATPTWGLRPVGTPPVSPGTVGNSISGTYLTEVAAKVKNKAFTVDVREGVILGDIVVRPVDETISAIQNAIAPGQELRVQVYGVGVQTTLADPDTTLRPTAAVSTGATDIYPIGPFEESDTH
jgi:beta-lactamase superfamily II metal-dependent hydrolase